MTEQLLELRNKIISLTIKKRREPLTEYDKRYLELLKETMAFVRANVLHKVSLEVIGQNRDVIENYNSYLNKNILKYRNRLQLLAEKRKTLMHKNGIDKKIQKTATNLQQAEHSKELFFKRYEVATMKPKDVSQVFTQLFYRAKEPFLSSTRFYNSHNDFLVRDDKTGTVSLNYANIYLVLEVFGQHKSDNFKKLLRIEEIKNDRYLSREEKIKLQNEIRMSIPEYLRYAEIHTLDRLCYYGASPLSIHSENANDVGRFIPSEQITDATCNCSPQVVQSVLDSLQIALVLDFAHRFTRQDLIALVGENKFQQYQNDIQSNVESLTFRSR